jgi:hypothetical protein
VAATWILWAATAAQAFPLVGLLRFGWRLTAARWWTLAWCAVFLLGDVVMIAVAQTSGRNLWTNYLVTPIEDVILLYLLSLWQREGVARLTYRVAIPLFLVTWAVLVFAVEDTNNFSLVAKPFQALLMAGASLYTLLARSLTERERVTQQDWFWVSLGTTLYYAPVTALHPFAHAFVATRVDLVRLAYLLKAGIDIVAFILIARGMLCPLTPERSGGSSAPAPSPSPSFSSPSAPRS